MKQIFLTVTAWIFYIAASCAAPDNMKPLSELTDASNSGWEQIMKWKESAKNKVEILAKDTLRADDALYEVQLSAGSPLGAIIYGCGGILVDNGWIRILGSGCSRLDRSVPEWNQGKWYAKDKDPASLLLVADDVMGGFFAVKTDENDAPDIREVLYYGPNSLRWETTGLNYSQFIYFCFRGDIQDFYEGFRWKGWENDVKQISCNEVVSCYPLLWTREAKELKVNRKLVSVQNQWDMYHREIKNHNKQKRTAEKPPKKKISPPTAAIKSSQGKLIAVNEATQPVNQKRK